ncbi:hypothetical protein A3L11_03515 [Thermococcus siculi]|uniref:Uncharacterized protein n=1 Tax=Thermococcus siculi TaxID=72803 RepID=A0A2Z2MKM2_9EURY|nr:hypothetical protein [Thermococcus siculi]ASJ08348.1 hypothetical protein A3L11_03515 [Thermococcus siculi]
MVRRETYLLTIIVILLLGTAVVITHRSSGGFSVVYFDNSTLPAHLSPGNVSTIVFVIESHENGEVGYSFEVSLDGRIIKNGSVSLSPGESVQVPVEVSVTNVTYEKVPLWNMTSVYNVSGALNITGNCVAVNSSGRSWVCLPASYKGPSDLNFLLNTNGNVSVVEFSTNNSATGKVTTRFELDILKMGEERYLVTVRETRIMYAPKNVLLEVTVESSRGKVYHLTRSFPVVGG